MTVYGARCEPLYWHWYWLKVQVVVRSHMAHVARHPSTFPLQTDGLAAMQVRSFEARDQAFQCLFHPSLTLPITFDRYPDRSNVLFHRGNERSRLVQHFQYPPEPLADVQIWYHLSPSSTPKPRTTSFPLCLTVPQNVLRQLHLVGASTLPCLIVNNPVSSVQYRPLDRLPFPVCKFVSSTWKCSPFTLAAPRCSHPQLGFFGVGHQPPLTSATVPSPTFFCCIWWLCGNLRWNRVVIPCSSFSSPSR